MINQGQIVESLSYYYTILLYIASHIDFKKSNSIEFDNKQQILYNYNTFVIIPSPGTKRRPKGEGANLDRHLSTTGNKANPISHRVYLFIYIMHHCVKEKIGRLQKPVQRNEKYKKRVYTLLWREGSNKIEKSETSVSMQGRRLYRQSFEERLQSDTRMG